MGNRTAYLLQIRVVKNGGPIHSEKIKGTVGDAFAKGDLLTLTNTGLVETLGTPVDTDVAAPIKYIALEAYDGVASEYVALQEITAATVLEGQISTGSAVQGSIGKQGHLIKDPTTGNYAVSISSATKALLEVVDAEPNYQYFAEDAAGNYNLLQFKFTPASLAIAPPAPTE